MVDAHIKQVLYSEVSIRTSDCCEGKAQTLDCSRALQIISLAMSSFKLCFTPVQ